MQADHPDTTLAKAAAELSHVAPAAWNAFMVALANATQVHINNVVASPLDVLQVNQGRAQGYTRIQKILQDCNKAPSRPKEQK